MSKTSIEQIVSREIERFEQHLKADLKSPRTIDIYTKAVEQLLSVCGKSPEQLTPDDVQRFKEYLTKKYGQNTVCVIERAANQYTQTFLRRPELKIRAPKMKEVTRIPLTEDEVREIREAALKTKHPMRDAALIDVLYCGGLRCFEVTNLTVSGLDLKKNRLRVNRGKGGDCRMVNLTSEASENLGNYVEHERGKPVKGFENALFVSGQGKPLCKVMIYNTVKSLAFDAGIEKNVHPHIFRHSMITNMAEKGVSPQMIQAQSGHKSLDMVARYIHLSEKSVRDSYDSVMDARPRQEPVRPIPAQPVQRGSEQVAYARLTHEDVLRARLEGKIDTPTMEAILGHLDAPSIPNSTPKARDNLPYFG